MRIRDYFYALIIGLVTGLLGLGPGGLFVGILYLWLRRVARQIDESYIARPNVDERRLLRAFAELQREAEAHERRLQGTIDVPFRVIK